MSVLSDTFTILSGMGEAMSVLSDTHTIPSGMRKGHVCVV